MGNLASKIVEDIKDESENVVAPSTPILTPKIRTLDTLDPRSPSAHIVRTPIQMILTPDKIEDSNVNKCDTFNINSPVPNVSAIDPRSPSTEFTRTPIVFNENSKYPNKLHNKNLDNVRKTLINVTPRKISDMSSYVPPKLLESNLLVIKTDENKRKSFVGVLETNLDYVETDLDEVIRQKKTIKQVEIPKEENLLVDKSNKIDCPSSVDNTKNADPRSPTIDFTRTPLQVSKQIDEVDQNIVTEAEETKGDIIVDDDGLILYKNEILVETISNEKNIEVSENVNNVAPKVIELTPKLTEKKNKITANITEFDRKISTLIYTDKEAEVLTKPIIVKEGSRTPLGIRNGQPKTKLRVSDKPRKSEYAVSKIPVFKDKLTINVKQSENIPPKSMKPTHNKPAKSAQWDGDNTLII